MAALRRAAHGGCGLRACCRSARRLLVSVSASSADGAAAVDKAHAKTLPAAPGVYLWREKGAAGRVLYVGKATNLRARVASYVTLQAGAGERLRALMRSATHVEAIVTSSAAAALLLERTLIRHHQPAYNVLLKDDDAYPSACVRWADDYPRIYRVGRRSEARDGAGAQYVGPFTDAGELRARLDLVQEVFPLRQRPTPLYADRPCLNYDMGLCPGACQGLVTPERYRETVRDAVLVLQGRVPEALLRMEARMHAAADEMRFEEAAQLRDAMKALQAGDESLPGGTVGGPQSDALGADRTARDTAAAAAVGDTGECVVQVFQLRDGTVTGRASYRAGLPSPSDADELGAALQRVLEDHYAALAPEDVPTEVLCATELPDAEPLEEFLTDRRREGRRNAARVRVRRARERGRRAEADRAAVFLAVENARAEADRLSSEESRTLAGLDDLQRLLGLQRRPRRLECYDISHQGGGCAVGSRVVFLDGKPAKHLYRAYNLSPLASSAGHPDDYASIAELMERRFEKSGTAPDLVVVDGGRGQLGAALPDVPDGVPVVALAKQRDEVFVPGAVLPLDTDPEQPGVLLLRHARDEAHRLAVHRSRQRHRRQVLASGT